MSLTSEVQNPDSFTRQFIDREFPNLKSLSTQISGDLKIYRDLPYPEYPDTYTYSLIGTAADYRIRFLYTSNAHKTVTIENGLKKFKYLYSYELNGEEQLNRLSSLNDRYEVRDTFYEHSKALLYNFNEDKICRFCLLLAKIDHFRRGASLFHFHKAMSSGVFDFQELILDCEESWVEDIHRLASAYKLANANMLSTNLNVVHGAVLAGSADIPGGADLDLVVDGCLVEIKATIKPKNLTNLLRQLVGYWLLDYDDEFKIRSARIDFIRQNHQVTLSALFDDAIQRKNVRSEFKAGLRSQRF